MVPCGLAGHRHCTVSVSRHTLHLRVVFFFFFFLALNFFNIMFFRLFNLIFFYNLYIYIYIFFLKYLRP